MRPLEARPLRVLVAAGGCRSGSTLQYNLVGVYLEHAGLGRRLGWVPPDVAVEVVGRWRESHEGIGVAKCHHVVPGYHDFGGRDEDWADLVDGGGVGVLTTRRRQEDVDRSMCRKFGLDPLTLHESPEWRENLANGKRWRELGGFEQSYDELTHHPLRALRAVTEAYGIPWSPYAAALTAIETSRWLTRCRQRRVPDGTWHPVTLIHWNHIGRRRPKLRRGWASG